MSDQKPQWPKRPAVLIRVPQRLKDEDPSAPPTEETQRTPLHAAAAPFSIKPGVKRRERVATEIYPVPAILSHSHSTDERGLPRKRMRLHSSMSIKRLNHRNGGNGFPTMFRPQVGAVGGKTEFYPKTNLWALFAAAICTLLVANSAPMDKLVQLLQSEGTTAQASPADKNKVSKPPLFTPLFGPQAVHDCSLRCNSLSSSSDGTACRSACEKLSLSEYARRIRLMDTSAKTDGSLIVESCSQVPSRDERAASVADWEIQAKSTYQLLRDLAETPQAGNFARARMTFGMLSQSIINLRYPPPNALQVRQQQLTEKLLRTSCLWAHATLIDLALVLVRQNNDDYSLRYYSELKQFVQRPLTQLEPALLKDGKVLLASTRL